MSNLYRCTYVKRYLHAMYVCRMRVPYYLSGIDISFPSISTSNLYDSYSYVLSVMTCNYFHVSVSRHGLRFITRDSLLSKLHTKQSLNSTRSNTLPFVWVSHSPLWIKYEGFSIIKSTHFRALSSEKWESHPNAHCTFHVSYLSCVQDQNVMTHPSGFIVHLT